MQWTPRAALVGLLLSCTPSLAIAANVDLIGADQPNSTQQTVHHPKKAAATPAQASPDQDSDDGGQWLTDARSGCRVYDTNYDDGDQASWSGACQGGVAEGVGTLSFANGGKTLETLTGHLSHGRVGDGHVVAAWSDGSKYDGEEKGGHMNGAGVFTTPQGDRLEGQWTDDDLAGKVHIRWANNDSYEGDWRDGKANGQGTEIWANGDRYDGGWHDGKAEGAGTQKWADGRSFSGQWKDDQPQRRVARADVPATAPPASPPVASVAPPARPPAAAIAAPTMSGAASDSVPAMSMAANVPGPAAGLSQSAASADSAPQPASDTKSSDGKVPILDGLSGMRLVSVDGSSIAFSADENGFTREIARPDGAALATSFVFINDRLGTVANTQDTSQTIGLFRVRDSEIDIDYADGRSEVLTPNPSGGLSIALASPDGRTYCMSWYPTGHVFSDDERKAAVAAYADRLGEANGMPAQAGSCAGSTIAKAAAANAASQAAARPTVSLQNVPRPIPKPTRISYETTEPMPTQSSFARDTSSVVVVRESNVHTIDAGADPKASASRDAMLAPPSDGASSCLTVDSDGTHWGFANRCGYSVQFAYCIAGDLGGPASCADGGISGSVAPNGFGALVADKSIQETGGEHDFRWVACRGGAGEVVPHLDRADPPAGRCVKPKAS